MKIGDFTLRELAKICETFLGQSYKCPFYYTPEPGTKEHLDMIWRNQEKMKNDKNFDPVCEECPIMSIHVDDINVDWEEPIFEGIKNLIRGE